MKKNNVILLIVFILLLIVSAIVLFTRYDVSREEINGKKKLRITQKTTSLEVLRDFAVEDTASINKIFLADKENNSILLERTDDHWTVNGMYDARHDFIDILLETIRRVEVYSPVPKPRQEYVIRDLSSNGIKCEIYQKGKRVRTYYVGGVTQDNLGTYMLLENSSEPFIVSIPGFSGYLTTRYATSLKEWRSKRVYSYRFDEIASVQVEFPAEPGESYKMVNKGNNKFELISLNDKMPVNDFDTVQVKQQIGRFKKVGFEFFVDDGSAKHKIDSLSRLTPMYRFVLTDVDGNKDTLTCYPRPNASKLKDDDGVMYAEDVERLYGIFDDELVVMQYYTMDALSVKLSLLLQ